MVSELVDWLRAQLDEDERVALAAAERVGPQWSLRRYEELPDDPFSDGVVADGGEVIGSGEVMLPEGEHIARFDPKRQLDEVEAKRRLLDLHPHRRFAGPLRAASPHEADHRPAFDEAPRYVGCETCHWDSDHEENYPSWWCDTVRLLALPFAGRDGYDESWRPE